MYLWTVFKDAKVRTAGTTSRQNFVHVFQWCCVHHHWPPVLPAMTPPCVEPLPLYRPRDPQASDLWRLLDQHFETFQQLYDDRFAAKYGFLRPVVERSVTAFLKGGDLRQGFARVRCPD